MIYSDMVMLYIFLKESIVIMMRYHVLNHMASSETTVFGEPFKVEIT